ncbi:TetR/AcrR family transcriptional regulator [Nonomuraea sp. bgisy101]|uniref:TetR/AcrR family transcriptional regulator n=1 Tax=Nonomuraea sp. bgisy101 TaxID=3413784 RepID=UPI003D722F44
MVTDHRKQPRRRGDKLNAAIFEAVLAELAEVGYAGMTMERVAERARTGKASLYRRWSSRMELAMEAVYHAMPDPSRPEETGSLRGDLLALLRRNADLLAGPAGEALRGLLSEGLADRSRMAELRRLSHGSSRMAMAEVVRRAVERGEMDASAVTPRRLEAGQAMLRHQFLSHGVPIPDQALEEIVDEVLVPLLLSPATPTAGLPATPSAAP